MNTPSIELCQKLEYIGYKNNNAEFFYDQKGIFFHKSEIISHLICNEYTVPAPTIAEMIELLPKLIRSDGLSYQLIITKLCLINKGIEVYEYQVGYDHGYDYDALYEIKGKLPDALAQMIILLREKNFIYFD